MVSTDEQWSTFFDEAYLPLYAPFLSMEKTRQEVDALLHLINLPQGSTVLDLGCGYGRHALLLATMGYQVTGLDKSQYLLHQAEVAALAQGVQIRWVHGDMRDIPFLNEFDAVLSLFSSFVYFEEEENLHVLRQMQRALKPSGFLLIDTLSLFRLIRNFTPSGITHYDNGLIVLEERRFDLLTSRNEVQITLLHPDGQRRQYQYSMRLYTPAELGVLCASVGLPVQAYYGGLDGSAVTMESRLVIVSRKVN